MRPCLPTRSLARAKSSAAAGERHIPCFSHVGSCLSVGTTKNLCSHINSFLQNKLRLSSGPMRLAAAQADKLACYGQRANSDLYSRWMNCGRPAPAVFDSTCDATIMTHTSESTSDASAVYEVHIYFRFDVRLRKHISITMQCDNHDPPRVIKQTLSLGYTSTLIRRTTPKMKSALAPYKTGARPCSLTTAIDSVSCTPLESAHAHRLLGELPCARGKRRAHAVLTRWQSSTAWSSRPGRC